MGTLKADTIVDSAGTGAPTCTNGIKSLGATASEIRVHTGNGYGSTNNKCRRFSSTTTSTGSDITFSDGAASGSSFTINKAGIYAMSYSDMRTTGNAHMGITYNCASLTTGIQSVDVNTRLASCHSPNSNQYGNCCVVANFSNGDVVRAMTDGSNDATTDAVQFVITQLAKFA
jgi:hypothetical protein